MSKRETEATHAVELEDDRARALAINEGLAGTDLHRGMVEAQAKASVPFRISPEPFWIEPELYREIEALGPRLRQFYQAANRLYLQSVRGSQPHWVRDYLERGKPESVLDYQRMRRFRTALPAIIRPDLLPIDGGFVLSELDSVPGGFGLLAALSREYARLGYDVIGGENGIVDGFWQALHGLVPEKEAPVAAIVVSDESDAYRGEMEWIANRLAAMGRDVVTVHPRELLFSDEGVFVQDERGSDNFFGVSARRVDVIYRFFELFDLKNIPKIDLILYAVRKALVQITPPLKSNLEEKLLMALFHHDGLRQFWRQQMDADSVETLRRAFPESWVVDSRPVPPHATIPGLEIGGAPLSDWRQLKSASQRERELVLKPSGFSSESWGSRGVLIGHDMPGDDWADGVERALESFETTPFVLQRFFKGRRFDVKYYDFEEGRVKTFAARVRLCPYYFCVGEATILGGILATACSLDKKIIHGMADAVMAPAAVAKAGHSQGAVSR